jgi:aspartate/methionine/tyrosine aminotransferase
VGALQRIGWKLPTPAATFYVWIPCPKRYNSTELCSILLDQADVVTTPGIGFGQTGEGYVRAALTVETPRLLEAVERIGKLKL